ncbi:MULTISPECIES: ABC transporter permease [unclassified Burkholderia]|uniref:ABC transporter permease n=1 Tax=unclassified Burkholderia TaxID=2613784 RepID=UPI002ABE3BF8|nr:MULTISPECIES: ABC transporter permease [unclassified Burkholderia]
MNLQNPSPSAAVRVGRIERRGRLSDDANALICRAVFVGAIAIALAFASDGFMTSGNLLNVLRQASLMFLLASGLTIVILSGGFDLSIAANLTLSACLAAGAMKAGVSPWLAVAISMSCGASIGLLNGLAVTFLRLPPFLATYGMLWVVQGLAFHYMGGNEIFGFPAGFRALGTGFWWGVPIPVYMMLLVLVVGSIVTARLSFGREIYAIGASPEVARLSGIPVRRRRIAVYTISGLMAGIAAVVYLARVNAADSAMGEPILLPAIAAILIGGASLFGGTGTLFGTLLGCVTLALVIDGMNLLNLNANWQPLVVGVVLLVAVLTDALGRRHAERIG